MECYFDNSATTYVYDEVIDLMVKIMREDYGNPSAMHKKGVEAERYIKEAKDIFSNVLKCKDKNIIFTSGGTESNNMAIFGAVYANKRTKNHILVSEVEHASVAACMDKLKKDGFDVEYLKTDRLGIVSVDDLKAKLRPDTALVSCMYVNNEIGSVMPIEAMAKVIHENSDAYFHVDAIQAFGKFRIYPKRLGIDLLSISSHKFHGPKGCGALYIGDGVRILPLIYGGGQQQDMRSGTENVPGIAGMALAAKICMDNLDAYVAHMKELKEYLIGKLTKLDMVTVNGYEEGVECAPNIVSLSFEGVRSEVFLHALEDKGIYVSAGSACSTNKPHKSHTLVAIGLPNKLIESTLRFSFCEKNTKEEIDYAVGVIEEILPMLRKYKRG